MKLALLAVLLAGCTHFTPPPPLPDPPLITPADCDLLAQRSDVAPQIAADAQAAGVDIATATLVFVSACRPFEDKGADVAAADALAITATTLLPDAGP